MLFWGILAGIFLVLEVLIPTLITIWMAGAAFIVMFISIFYYNFYVLALIFFALTAIFLIFTRPLLQKYIFNNTTNFDSTLKGKKVKIEKVIDIDGEIKYYEVRIKGVLWTAISDDIYIIGDYAKITDMSGNKIIL